MQFGAFGVVLETLISGITELPFSTFISFMQPIHLAIGIVEGVITGVVLNFVWQNRPDLLEKVYKEKNIKISNKKIIRAFLVFSLIIGGLISWFASQNPDGLEWSMLQTSGSEQLETKEGAHNIIANIQEKTAIFMEYNLKIEGLSENLEEIGTSVAGISGVILTTGCSFGVGYLLMRKNKLKIRIK